MKKFIIIISIISLFFGFIFDTFAINAPLSLKVESSTDNSVNLSWDKVEKAFMYSVYYSKTPGAQKAYDNQTDYIEKNTVEIKNLSAGTYYFSVVALNDLGEESTFGKEISLEIKSSKKTTTTETTTTEIVSTGSVLKEVSSTKNTTTETAKNSGLTELNSANQIADVTDNNTATGVELLAAAEVTENLPTTGTEHILLLLASMVLGLGLFVFRIKKS